LSRAADAELADICLEQQVLREMILAQQPADNSIQQRDAKQSRALRPKPVASTTVSSVVVVAAAVVVCSSFLLNGNCI